MQELENVNSKSVTHVIENFVIGNVGLQIIPEVFKKGWVAIPYLEGPPGIGKTSILGSKLQDLNWGLLTIQPALKPIEEYGGIPKFKNIKLNEEGEKILGTQWSIPEVLVQLHKLSEKHDLVVFFWDDIHLCGPEHLALMQECFSERSIRGYKLPDNVAIVLAGNNSSKAGYRSQSSAIINRCVKLPVHPDYDSWKNNFAIKNQIHPAIISFLGHPMYAKYLQEEEQIDTPWASVRQWTRLSNFIVAYESQMGSMDPDNLLYYATGHVGKEAASEFSRYHEIFSKFDMKTIFENSKDFQLASDPIDRYIAVFAIVTYFVNAYNKNTKKALHEQLTDIVGEYLKSEESLGLLMLREIGLIDTKAIGLKTRIDFLELLKTLDEKHPGLINKVLNTRKELNDE